MRRHGFAVEAHFDFTIAVTFSLPVATVAKGLYPGLQVDQYEDHGFLAIALVQTRSMRPAGLPESLGRDFFLTGYRYFVRHKQGRRSVRGLQVLRSDTDSEFLKWSGNLMTHYRYSRAITQVNREGGVLRVKVGGADVPGLDLTAYLDEPELPADSIFPDLRTARRFAGPMPFTFSHESETGSLISVEGRRSKWHPKAVRVEIAQADFLNTYPEAERPRQAAAFFVEDVPYRWERGTMHPIPGARGTGSAVGATNIVRFNFPTFLGAGAIASGAAMVAALAPRQSLTRKVAAGLAIGIAAGAATSLAASHSVYDRSQLRDAGWLADRLQNVPGQVGILHSGLDETTCDLRNRLPERQIVSIDLYDPVRMTEPSITRARELRPPPADAVRSQPGSLPFKDGYFGVVVMMFAAHEWRKLEERAVLFQEIRRVLGENGALWIVEHVRDFPNVLAFGPGASHFLPKSVWREEPLFWFDQEREEALHPLVKLFQFRARTAVDA